MIDKSAFDIIGDYYEKPQPPDFRPGQICEATVYYLPAGPLRVLKFDIQAANRGDPVTYEVAQSDDATFRHSPAIRPYPLEHNEAFAVVTAKHRPVVLLSGPIIRPEVTGLPKQDFPDAHLVVPLFSFRDNHPTEFRLRLEAWEWSVCFHMPASDVFEITEGFLRFDRILVIPSGQLRLRPVALTESATLALNHCFAWFTTGKLDPYFAEYRALLVDALSKIP